MDNIMEICAWAKSYGNLLWAGFPHFMNINNFSTETSAQYSLVMMRFAYYALKRFVYISLCLSYVRTSESFEPHTYVFHLDSTMHHT